MSSNSGSQAPKPSKRVDVDSGSLKRAADGSAFTRCDHCRKDIPIAIADMHDCGMDEATKSRLRQNVATKPAPEVAKKKRSSTSEESKKQKGGEKKKAKQSKESNKKVKKDPNMPKKPLTAFFVFMEDFRKTKKEENAGLKPSQMTKHGGERWKEMTDEEKAPYIEKASKLKEEYEAAVKKYKSGGDAKGDDNEEHDSTAEAEGDEEEET